MVRNIVRLASASTNNVRVGVVDHWIVMRTAVNFANGASVTGRLRTTATNNKPRHSFEAGVSVYGLAVTYFRVRNAHYHRRKPVSRFCSGWEGVGPGCCGRQIEEE